MDELPIELPTGKKNKLESEDFISTKIRDMIGFKCPKKSLIRFELINFYSSSVSGGNKESSQ